MNQSSRIAIAALAFAVAPATWAANTITAIVPGANRVALVDGKAAVKFMVSGQGNDDGDCGIWINYGDQDSPDTRIIGRRDGMFPREFEHVFSKTGQFTVTAKGERTKQTFGCVGEASTSVTVVAATSGRRRVATVSCPDGWQLKDGSYNRETGAYTCAASYPEQRMDCGPGLRYFERDNLIGCRARGNGQR